MANLLLNLSSIRSQIPTDLCGAPRGRPKYVVGRKPVLQPSSVVKASTFSLPPIGKISLLPKLIFSPRGPQTTSRSTQKKPNGQNYLYRTAEYHQHRAGVTALAPPPLYLRSCSQTRSSIPRPCLSNSLKYPFPRQRDTGIGGPPAEG